MRVSVQITIERARCVGGDGIRADSVGIMGRIIPRQRATGLVVATGGSSRGRRGRRSHGVIAAAGGRVDAQPCPLGDPVDALNTLSATPIAGRGVAATPSLPGMAALAGLADAASRQGEGRGGGEAVGFGGRVLVGA